MNVEYAAYSHRFEDVVAKGSYAEARARAEWEDDHVDVWLMVDDWPILTELPLTFDRLVILPDGTELRTAVMQGNEIESAWGPEGFGIPAPLLKIDRQAETVTLDQLLSITILWPQDLS